jgi:transposase-like protein
MPADGKRGSYQRWPISRIQIVTQMHAGGMTYAVIARRLRVTRSQVAAAIHKARTMELFPQRSSRSRPSTHASLPPAALPSPQPNGRPRP